MGAALIRSEEWGDVSELYRLLLGSTPDDALEGEEFLEWGDDGESGLSRRVLIGGAAAVAVIIAALVIRRRRAIAALARAAESAARRATPAAPEDGLALGPGQRSHLGVVFDATDREPEELEELAE